MWLSIGETWKYEAYLIVTRLRHSANPERITVVYQGWLEGLHSHHLRHKDIFNRDEHAGSRMQDAGCSSSILYPSHSCKLPCKPRRRTTQRINVPLLRTHHYRHNLLGRSTVHVDADDSTVSNDAPCPGSTASLSFRKPNFTPHAPLSLKSGMHVPRQNL